MNAIAPKVRKADLPVVPALAELLERLDVKLVNGAPGPALSVLPGNPAAADDGHENINDQPAGLCGSALEASLASMRQAKEVLGQAMRRP